MPSASLLARASTATTDVEKTAEAIVADVLAETEPVAEERSAARTYRVRSGDTLYAIAKRTGTTVTQLKSWNKLRGIKPEDWNAAPDPVAAFRQRSVGRRECGTHAGFKRSRSFRRCCWRGGT